MGFEIEKPQYYSKLTTARLRVRELFLDYSSNKDLEPKWQDEDGLVFEVYVDDVYTTENGTEHDLERLLIGLETITIIED